MAGQQPAYDQRRPKRAPGPAGGALFGSLLEARRDRPGFLMRLAEEYGDIARFRLGARDFFLINHPSSIEHVLQDNYSNYHKGIGLSHAGSLLGQGLLTSEGEPWLHQRRLMQPAFHHQQIERFASVITDHTGTMLDRWRLHASSEQPVEILSEMMRLTLRILGSSLLGTDIENDARTVGAGITAAMEHAIHRMMLPVNLPEWLPTPRNIRYRRTLCMLDDVIHRIIEKHRAVPESNDLLSLLMQDTIAPESALENRQLRDQIMTIIFAGHETTATALTWALHLVSTHPEIQRRLHAESAQVLGNREPTLEDLPHLCYAKMVIEEAMRLYPPVWIIPRKAQADDEILGYRIPAGSEVLLSPYTMHRRGEYWENPEKFDPERFNKGRQEGRKTYVYFPFGAGPRNCIGKNFAMMETQLILAMVAREFRVTGLGTSVEAEGMLSLRPGRGIVVKLRSLRKPDAGYRVR